eukprot:Gb_31234 [translate_table: standard]
MSDTWSACQLKNRMDDRERLHIQQDAANNNQCSSSDVRAIDLTQFCEKQSQGMENRTTSNGQFEVEAEMVAHLVQDKNICLLEELGGILGIAAALQTDIHEGISGDLQDLQNRQKLFGENKQPQTPERCFVEFLLDPFRDRTIITRMICAMMVSLGVGIESEGVKNGWYDGATSFFAIVLVVTVTALCNYGQYRQFRKLNSDRSNIHSEIVRGGQNYEISICGLVVGDIVRLRIGDQVPADGLLVVRGSDCLGIDESSITGVTDLVLKNENNPFLTSGTKVAIGDGYMLITAVGTNTRWDRFMQGSISKKTPLQIRLNGVTRCLEKIARLAAVVVLVILLFRYLYFHTSNRSIGGLSTRGLKGSIRDVLGIILIAITIDGLAMPEGLLHALTTLSLAFTMRKIMADKALVRDLSACETMGFVTTICTDKTGTLTLHHLRVTRVWAAGEMRSELPAEVYKIPKVIHSLLIEAVGLNTDELNGPGSAVTAAQQACGCPTDEAILAWGRLELDMNTSHLRSNYSILNAEAFNSENKRRSVTIKELETEEFRVHWKGAAEIILDMCTTYVDNHGSFLELKKDKKEYLKALIEEMASVSLRCIALAYTQCAVDSVKDGEEALKMRPVEGLTLLAVVGLTNLCRPGIGKAIQSCREAGVSMRMVTGDNVFTAKAIALECGILDPNQVLGEPVVIEGSTFSSYSQEQRRECIDKICVMARSSPSDKSLMVQTLMEKGHVVAVIGDGTNDAPALHKANMGLAMGQQRSEIIKQISNIIILDENFSSVVMVVRWGRSMYSNIQNLFQFQLTVNVTAIVINSVAAVLCRNTSLNAFQLMWVNLIVCTMAALAMATAPPSDELMRTPPVGSKEPAITNTICRNVVGQVIYQTAVLLTLEFKGKTILGLKGDNTENVTKMMVFNTFVMCQIFDQFNARKPDKKNIFQGIEKSYLFIGIVGVSVILQVFMVEILKKIESSERLDWGQWMTCIGLASMSWPMAWLVKSMGLPKRPFVGYINFWETDQAEGEDSRHGDPNDIVENIDFMATEQA